MTNVRIPVQRFEAALCHLRLILSVLPCRDVADPRDPRGLVYRLCDVIERGERDLVQRRLILDPDEIILLPLDSLLVDYGHLDFLSDLRNQTPFSHDAERVAYEHFIESFAPGHLTDHKEQP